MKNTICLVIIILICWHRYAVAQPYDTDRWEKLKQYKSWVKQSDLPLLEAVQSFALNNNKDEDYYLASTFKLFSNVYIKETDNIKSPSSDSFFIIARQYLANTKQVYSNLMHDNIAQYLLSYKNSKDWNSFDKTSVAYKPELISTYSKSSLDSLIFHHISQALAPNEQLYNLHISFPFLIPEEKRKKINSELMPISVYHLIFTNYLWYFHNRKENTSIQNLYYKSIENIEKNYKAVTNYNALHYFKYEIYKKAYENKFIDYREYAYQLINLEKKNNAAINPYLLAKGVDVYYDKVGFNKLIIDTIKMLYSLIEKAIEKYPKSIYLENLKEVQNKLRLYNLDMDMMEYIVAEHNIPIYVVHKNVDTIFIKIYNIPDKVPNTFLPNIPMSVPTHIDTSLSKTPFLTLNIPLDAKNNDTLYKSLYYLPKLPIGKYKIIYSNSSAFPKINYQFTTLHTEEFSVNKKGVLGYPIKYEKETEDIRVLGLHFYDRISGFPIKNSQVQIIISKNKNDGNKIYNLIEELRTDEHGEICLNQNLLEYYKDNDIIFRIKENGELFSLSDLDDEVDLDFNNDLDTTLNVFASKAIYRPNDTIHFKAILHHENNIKSRTLSNQKIRVVYEIDGVEMGDKKTFITNDFGSISGYFIAPDFLPKQVKIKFYFKEQILKTEYINIEEYKLEKIKLDFDKQNKDFDIGDSITITGKATYNNGAPITDGWITYKASRIIFIDNNLYNKDFFENNSYLKDDFFRYDSTLLNQDGTFTITIPNPRYSVHNEIILHKDSIFFRYNYIIDVTLNTYMGENITERTSAQVYESNRLLKLNMEKNVFNTSDTIPIFTQSKTNFNKKLNASGNIKVEKIKPNNSYRNQYLSKLLDKDCSNCDDEKWNKIFPFYDTDLYKETAMELIYKSQYHYNLTTDSGYQFVLRNLPAGAYNITITDTSEIVQKNTERNFYVVDTYKNKKVENTYFDYAINSSELYVGDTFIFNAYSSLDSCILKYIVIEETQEQNTLQYKEFKDGKVEIRIPITERHLGGLVFEYLFHKNNYFQSKNINIRVKQKPNKLAIKKISFRDKIKTNAVEQWTFQIGTKQDLLDTILIPFKNKFEVLAYSFNNAVDKIKTQYISFSKGRYSYYWITNILSNEDSYESISNTKSNIKKHYETKAPELYLQYLYEQMKYAINFQSDVPIYDAYYNGIRKETYTGSATVAHSLNGSVQGVVVSGSPGLGGNIRIRGYGNINPAAMPLIIVNGEIFTGDLSELPTEALSNITILKDANSTAIYGSRGVNGVILIDTKNTNKNEEPVIESLRTNLKDYSFFQPHIVSDSAGLFQIMFNSPEAFATWRLNIVAHDTAVNHLIKSYEFTTQKDIMVLPNMPRFVREGDTITFSTSIANLTDQMISGKTSFQLIDADSKTPLQIQFIGSDTKQVFSINPKSNVTKEWKAVIPSYKGNIAYRILAYNDAHSDGEENTLIFMSKSVPITELVPIWIDPYQKKEFPLTRMQSLEHDYIKGEQIKLIISSDYLQNIVPSLLFLNDYPYDCSEQLFAKYYSNVMLHNLYTTDSSFNKHLKSYATFQDTSSYNRTLINEKKQVASLIKSLEQNTLYKNKIEQSLKQLFATSKDGFFPWFANGKVDTTITTYIVTGFGKLSYYYPKLQNDYLPKKYQDELKKTVEVLANSLPTNNSKLLNEKNAIIESVLDRLYAISFFNKNGAYDKALYAFIKPLTEDLLDDITISNNVQHLGKLALIMHRIGNKSMAKTIMTEVKDRAVMSETNGMYWKENIQGWRWTEDMIANHTLLMQAYAEIISDDVKSLDLMKKYLVRSFKNGHFGSTRSTTEAITTILHTGLRWVSTIENMQVNYKGLNVLNTTKTNNNAVLTAQLSRINNEEKKIIIEQKANGILHGGLFWQYEEDINKIIPDTSNIYIKKELYRKTNTASGDRYQLIADGDTLSIGDKIFVIISIRVNQLSQYLHIKDYRASGLEPVRSISGYSRDGNIYSFHQPRDLSYDIFIDDAAPGSYTFEYELKVNNKGIFNNGHAIIENMYAPELNAHTHSKRIVIN